MHAQDTSQFCVGAVVCPVSPSARALARLWAPAQGRPLLVFQRRVSGVLPAARAESAPQSGQSSQSGRKAERKHAAQQA